LALCHIAIRGFLLRAFGRTLFDIAASIPGAATRADKLQLTRDRPAESAKLRHADFSIVGFQPLEVRPTSENTAAGSSVAQRNMASPSPGVSNAASVFELIGDLRVQ